jgi:predicted dinucleotide-utilizing enzyme
MIWLAHKKYTTEYVSEQLVEICDKMRRETRRMIYIATGAIVIMAAIQATYLFELLNA